MEEERGVLLVCRAIPELHLRRSALASKGAGRGNFACISVEHRDYAPTTAQFIKQPLALVACVPRDVTLFLAGAVAGAAAKTLTAPLDRVKLLMQTHGLRVGQESAKKAIGFFEALVLIGKEEGLRGYWKGNLPQVIRIIPYSAAQLFAYEAYKKLFRDVNGELSVVGRLAAGACAGMTSTFVTYPLDVLRLRLAVETGSRTMTEVISVCSVHPALSLSYAEKNSNTYPGCHKHV